MMSVEVGREVAVEGGALQYDPCLDTLQIPDGPHTAIQNTLCI